MTPYQNCVSREGVYNALIDILKIVQSKYKSNEVNKREIHECDGRADDPDTMVAPLTPKPTRKAEALSKAPPTIASSREEDAALKEVAKPRLCCANGIFETKTKDGSTAAKARPTFLSRT